MTPEVKKIGNKLFDKVELALTDDVDAKLQTANRLYDISLKGIREINSGVLNNCILNYTECIKISDNIINKAKELGLEANNIVASKNIAIKNLKDAENIKSKLSNI